MGNRISISFKNGNDESVVLFSHWGGRGFLNDALDYVSNLHQTIKNRAKTMSCPIDRLEPDTVMVDFIRHITKNVELVESDLYVCPSESQGDNSDNGHFTIDLLTGRFK